GVVDERRARVILAELRGHERRVAHLVEAAVLAQAGGLNPVQLRRKIKALLLRLAPVGSEQRHQRAREGRYVRLTPGEDGMTYLDGLLPAEDAAALKAVLEAGQQGACQRCCVTAGSKFQAPPGSRPGKCSSNWLSAAIQCWLAAPRMSSFFSLPPPLDVLRDSMSQIAR